MTHDFVGEALAKPWIIPVATFHTIFVGLALMAVEKERMECLAG
jgi:hypothetical protein